MRHRRDALYFAGRGRTVTGIDFPAEPITRVKRKATERGLKATFPVMDALTLKAWPERFDRVIDSGLFHLFDDRARRRYVERLASVVKPGGKLSVIGVHREDRTEGFPESVEVRMRLENNGPETVRFDPQTLELTNGRLLPFPPPLARPPNPITLAPM